MQPSVALIEALAVTVELTDTQLSKAAATVMARDLAAFPESQVLGALVRCRRELKGRLTIADVLSRLDDGRPGAEEAWAMLPRSEADSVVWTTEMAEAFGVAVPLMSEPVQARMAFLEQYREKVRRARDRATPVRWIPSLGTDPRGREAAVLIAIEAGRITAERAQDLLPPSVSPSIVARLDSMMPKRLEDRGAAT